MKANSGKCDFICSINDKVNVIIENQKNSNNKKQQSMQKAVTAWKVSKLGVISGHIFLFSGWLRKFTVRIQENMGQK